MEHLVAFDAILFPSDGRPPTIVQLMTSPMTMTPTQSGQEDSRSRMPHPEAHIDYIAEGYGSRAWKYQLIEALDGMNQNFTDPYIIFYPTVSRDGMPFPVNSYLKDIQGQRFREETAWRGNIVIAKYHDDPFTGMMHASMADFAILKIYLTTYGCPS